VPRQTIFSAFYGSPFSIGTFAGETHDEILEIGTGMRYQTAVLLGHLKAKGL